MAQIGGIEIGLFSRAGSIIRTYLNSIYSSRFPGARTSNTTSGAFRLVPYSPNQSLTCSSLFRASFRLDGFNPEPLRPNPIGRNPT